MSIAPSTSRLTEPSHLRCHRAVLDMLPRASFDHLRGSYYLRKRGAVSER